MATKNETTTLAKMVPEQSHRHAKRTEESHVSFGKKVQNQSTHGFGSAETSPVQLQFKSSNNPAVHGNHNPGRACPKEEPNFSEAMSGHYNTDLSNVGSWVSPMNIPDFDLDIQDLCPNHIRLLQRLTEAQLNDVDLDLFQKFLLDEDFNMHHHLSDSRLSSFMHCQSCANIRKKVTL